MQRCYVRVAAQFPHVQVTDDEVALWGISSPYFLRVQGPPLNAHHGNSSVHDSLSLPACVKSSERCSCETHVAKWAVGLAVWIPQHMFFLAHYRVATTDAKTRNFERLTQ